MANLANIFVGIKIQSSKYAYIFLRLNFSSASILNKLSYS